MKKSKESNRLVIQLKIMNTKKIKKGKEREGKANERRREKRRDKREGMKGYLETPPPSLTTVPNGETLLAPFASLGFLSLLIFSIFSLCFCVLLFSMKFCSCDTQISSFYIVSSPFVPYYSFPSYYYFFCFIFVLPFL